MKKLSAIILLATIGMGLVNAQLEGIDPAYKTTLEGRADKIVKTLNLMDSNKEARVLELIVIQYYQLSLIHDGRDVKMEAIGDLEGNSKEEAKAKISNETDAALYKRHAIYLASLSTELSAAQIDMVKDGMTYGVVERTYSTYMNLLPNLSDEQKKFLYKSLIEAREHAMDAGSSKAKHAWFGKYKGRINNYLSAQGIDMKQAEEDYKKRTEGK